jgi:hypothetical protein
MVGSVAGRGCRCEIARIDCLPEPTVPWIAHVRRFESTSARHCVQPDMHATSMSPITAGSRQGSAAAVDYQQAPGMGTRGRPTAL